MILKNNLKLNGLLALMLINCLFLNCSFFDDNDIDYLNSYKNNFKHLILEPLTLQFEDADSSSKSIRELFVSPKGDIISFASDFISVWDSETGQLKYMLDPNNPITMFKILLNGDLLTCYQEDQCKIWDLETGKLKCVLDKSSHTKALTILPNGDIAISNHANICNVWDQKTYKLKKESLFFDHRRTVKQLDALANGDIVSIVDNVCKIWDLESGNLKFALGHNDLISGITTLSNGDIVTASYDHTAKVWDSKTRQVKFTLADHNAEINTLKILPNDEIMTGSRDEKTIKIWNSKIGTLKYTLRHGHSITSLTLYKDDDLITGCYAGLIRIWDLKTGQLKFTLHAHQDQIEHIVILANGDIASTSWDETVKIWDSKTLKLKYILNDHTLPITALAVLPNGNMATGSYDGTIKIWKIPKD